ncbi:MAG: alpha-1,2-fucosyltransferase [Acidimicrobiales bacterium]|jgi:hypothetical protein
MTALSRQSRNKLAARYGSFASSTIPSRANDTQHPPPRTARDTGTMHWISGLYSLTESSRASHTPRERGAYTMPTTGFDGHPVKPEGITVYMRERLGNQLFIYAAGLAQARRLGTPCYANLAFYRRTWPRRTYRKSCDLGFFDSGVVVPEEDQFHRPLFSIMPISRAAMIWHNRVAPLLPLRGRKIFMETSSCYDERIQNIEPGTTLFGMFQSWRYFENVADEIRERVSTVLRPSDWYVSMARQLTPGSGAIALNVRRGDYLRPAQQRFHGLAERGYYERSLRHLRRLGLDGPVYVASDSLDAVLQEFARIADLVPIAPPQGVAPLEVMLLLSRADGLVAGNSSFSWWAGFIGDRTDHVVVAPRPWFTSSDFDSRDLLPRSWLTLDRANED